MYQVYLCILGCESNENIPAYIRACCALDLMSKTAVSCFLSDDDDDNDNDGDGDGDDDVNNSYLKDPLRCLPLAQVCTTFSRQISTIF